MKRPSIHIDNYEEYFLLYVDDELTTQERNEVEAFVREHPELRSELDMYLDTRLKPETLRFDGKEELLRFPETVHADNIEELQVQWIDGELAPEMAARVEAYTERHPEALVQLSLLRQTKLQPEPISFPDKSSLYRKEEKPVVLFRMQWLRVAVAAAVLLLAGLYWINRESAEESTTGPSLAGVDQSKTILAPGSNAGAETKANTNGLAATTPVDRQDAGVAPNVQDRKTNTQVAVTRAGTAQKDLPVTYAAVDRTTMTNPEEPQQMNTGTNEIITTAPGIQLPQQTNPLAQEAVAMHVKTDYVSDALTQEQFNGQEELNPDENKTRKGFRGLIRKVNRIYNKATNPDPEKAMVKVASFEIGLPR